MSEVIHLSPSILNAYQALYEETPGWDGQPFMTPAKFKDQVLGREKMSDAAKMGTAIHQACWEGGEEVEVEGNWIVDPSVPTAVNAFCGFSKGDGGVPEVPFLMHFPQYRARLSGRCDVLYDDRTIEGKTTTGSRGMRPTVDKYVRLPQTEAYATYFQVPCEIYVVHVKQSKPRDRPKGAIGLLKLASEDAIQKAVVYPTEKTKESLDRWVANTAYYVSQDEEILAYLLAKGRKEPRGF